MGEKIKKFMIKMAVQSKIVWTQLLTIALLVVNNLGVLQVGDPEIIAFVGIILTVILQKFFSSKPIFITNTTGGDTTFTVFNIVSALVIISDYFLQHSIFNHLGFDPLVVATIVSTINIALRMFLLNQPMVPTQLQK